MPRFWHPHLPTVSRTGAPAGCVLGGALPRNQGLRIRVAHAQARGSGGPVVGPFEILDAGDNDFSWLLAGLRGRPTDAAEVLRALRRWRPACVSVVNANALTAEG